MKPNVDYSLYLVVDPAMCSGRRPEDVVREAVLGGVTVVQLRNKTGSAREFIAQAESLHVVLRPLGVPLIINDRVDVALAVGAEGVHVGQSDIPPDVARRLLGDAVIGLSVDTVRQATDAEPSTVDYLGVGPVYPTLTKTDTSPEWGCAGLRELRPLCSHALVAIGGVNASNAADVMATGVDGIAVVSAICGAADPRAAAEQLRRIIDGTEPSAGPK